MNAQAQAKSLVEVCGGDKEKAWLNALETSRTCESDEHREFWLAVADECCRVEDVLWTCTCGSVFDSGYAAFLHRRGDEHHVSPIPAGRKE